MPQKRKSYVKDNDLVSKPEGLARKVLRLLGLILLIALIPEAYKGWKDLYVNILEREEPIISVEEMPAGIGLQPTKLKIIVRDKGAGLEEVVIRSEQRKEVKTLLRRSYSGQKKNEDLLEVEIPGKESGLKEGNVEISVKAFDRSFWSNGTVENFSLGVDYKKPKIEVLSTQHNAVIGGAELVFYRIPDDREAASGLRVGDGLFFPGFPAKDLDSDFEAYPDIFFSLFAIPLEFDEKNDKLLVYARDAVGNLSLSPIYYRTRKIATKKKVIRLEEQFLRDKVSELLISYVETKKTLQRAVPQINLTPQNNEELVKNFRVVNEEYREFAEQALQPLFVRPKRQRYWQEKFLRLENAATQAQFGEERSYVFENLAAGSSLHEGMDLASSAHSSVRAANGGVVIFATEIGLYGKTVIIDHGFGLYTLYGHLSSIKTIEGTQVEKGAVIGVTGNTGFAEGDHLHFEIRIHGIPVNPIEWWDQKWLDDHIEQKIVDMKRVVGAIKTAPLH